MPILEHECVGDEGRGRKPAVYRVSLRSGQGPELPLILLLGVDVIWLTNEGAEWYPVMFGAGVTMIGAGVTMGQPPPEDGQAFPAPRPER